MRKICQPLLTISVVYAEFQNLNIELYTDEKNPELEEKVQAVLTRHELFWQNQRYGLKLKKCMRCCTN